MIAQISVELLTDVHFTILYYDGCPSLEQLKKDLIESDDTAYPWALLEFDEKEFREAYNNLKKSKVVRATMTYGDFEICIEKIKVIHIS